MKSGSPSRTTATHKTQTKIQAWSSLVFHCCHSSFIPSEAPPWDSRPVSGAGVVHFHLLHRPRSVPTALGPAPLTTVVNRTRGMDSSLLVSVAEPSILKCWMTCPQTPLGSRFRFKVLYYSSHTQSYRV